MVDPIGYSPYCNRVYIDHHISMIQSATDSAPNHSEASRLDEITNEYSSARQKLTGIGPAVSIFGSSRTQRDDPYYELARLSAKHLSDAGYSIISGGGPGIMEAVNMGAQQGNSRSVGLNILLPGSTEPANAYLDIQVDFQHFFIRKLMFVEFASAYVVMPGGFGTLDELLECITLMQTRKAPRLPVILADRKFWLGMLNWFEDTLLAEGTINQKDLDAMVVVDHPHEISEAIKQCSETNET